MQKNAVKVEVKKAAEENNKGSISLKHFVMNKWKSENLKPKNEAKDHDWSQYKPEVDKKHRLKLITGFYDICASGGQLDRADVEEYLINCNCGQPGETLEERDWIRILAIRTYAQDEICGRQKY